MPSLGLSLLIYKMEFFLKKRYLHFCFWLCWVLGAERMLSLVAVSGGYSQVAVCRFLIALASPVAEYQL